MSRLKCWKNVLLSLGFIVVSVTFCFVSKLSKTSNVSKNELTCSPKRNIVFLKIHKCASSTVQNMFLRYAASRNLTIMLPLFAKDPYLSKLKLFSRKVPAVDYVPWKILGFNILCHHTRFNKFEMAAVMPQDTIYVSIVRDPASLFESLYEYNNLAQFYNLTINEYIKSIQKQNLSMLNQRAGGNLGPNQMLFDFGMDLRNMSIKTVSKFVHKLDKEFDYVMIAEHFDESIIILKKLLCWDYNDVITLNKNVRLDGFKHKLNREEITMLRKWNWGDQILYQHFLHKHHMLINRFGRKDIKQEVHKLCKLRKKMLRNCIKDSILAKNISNVWSDKILGFRKNPNNRDQTCNNIVKSERELTNELRQQQLLRCFRYGMSTKNNTILKEFKNAMKNWLYIQKQKDNITW